MTILGLVLNGFVAIGTITLAISTYYSVQQSKVENKSRYLEERMEKGILPLIAILKDDEMGSINKRPSIVETIDQYRYYFDNDLIKAAEGLTSLFGDEEELKKPVEENWKQFASIVWNYYLADKKKLIELKGMDFKEETEPRWSICYSVDD